MRGLPAICSACSRTALPNPSRSSASRASARTCWPKRCWITFAGTLPGRKPLILAPRAISRRRPSTTVSRRSAGRLKVTRRSRLPRVSTEACIADDSCCHAVASAGGVLKAGLAVWLSARREIGQPAELASFADYRAGCQLRGRRDRPAARPEGRSTPQRVGKARRLRFRPSPATAFRPPADKPNAGNSLSSRRLDHLARSPLAEAAWCERRDSNPHALRHWNLNPGRLPIPPLSRGSHSRPTDCRQSKTPGFWPGVLCLVGRQGFEPWTY